MNLTIIIGENKNIWDKNLTSELFDLLYDNPFVQNWERMKIGLEVEIVINPDKKEAIKRFCDYKGEFSASFETKEAELIVSRLNNSNKISMSMHEQLLLDSKHKLFLNFMLQITKTLPKFRRLTGMADYDYNELYEKHNLELVKCCGILKLSWVHVIARSEYEGIVSKTDLLATPAFSVKEIENEAVLIQVYENPFDYENETSIEYMRNVTEHLRAKRTW
ncbi:MAG: hypothetical protein Q8K92_20095 [Leadbetterella sp.]|nr:hypothetical protein [Leadbetterella sp.]